MINKLVQLNENEKFIWVLSYDLDTEDKVFENVKKVRVTKSNNKIKEVKVSNKDVHAIALHEVFNTLTEL